MAISNFKKLSWEKILKLARSENTSSDILVELSQEHNQELRRIIASNPNTPIEVLKNLGEDYADEITSNPIFDLLLIENYDSKFLKSCLACSSNTQIKTLEKLSCDLDYSIRAKVAENQNISGNILSELAKDENYDVIKSLIKNKNVTQDILEILTSNMIANNYFSHEIIKHPKSSTNILRLLVDGYCNNRTRIFGNACVSVAQHPKTPVDILAKLARSNVASVRRGVAGNKQTPNKLLAELSSDNATSVIRAVARNPKTSKSLLAELAEHSDKSIRSAVAQNHKTPIDILAKLAADSNDSVRSTVAENYNTPIEILTKLANDSNTSIRFALVIN